MLCFWAMHKLSRSEPRGYILLLFSTNAVVLLFWRSMLQFFFSPIECLVLDGVYLWIFVLPRHICSQNGISVWTRPEWMSFSSSRQTKLFSVPLVDVIWYSSCTHPEWYFRLVMEMGFILDSKNIYMFTELPSTVHYLEALSLTSEELKVWVNYNCIDFQCLCALSVLFDWC